MKILANEGANFVPIAMPPICKKCLLSNSKLFVDNTSFNRLHREWLVGFSFGSLFRKSVFLTASIPSSFGILVYKLVTSKVHKIASSGILKFPKILMRWLLSRK